MSHDELARKIVGDEVGPDFEGFGVVYSFSGRDRRRRAKGKSDLLLLKTAGLITRHLHDTYDIADANRLVAEAGFSDHIVITFSRAELLKSIAGRFDAGDNIWDPHPYLDDVLAIGFWYDSTHRR